MDLPVTVFDWLNIIQFGISAAIPFRVSLVTLYELWLNDIDFDLNIEQWTLVDSSNSISWFVQFSSASSYQRSQVVLTTTLTNFSLS